MSGTQASVSCLENFNFGEFLDFKANEAHFLKFLHLPAPWTLVKCLWAVWFDISAPTTCLEVPIEVFASSLELVGPVKEHLFVSTTVKDE